MEKVEVADTLQIDTLKYIEKKLTDKGFQRKDRHPVDGIPPNRQPKSGHGGKYTWEGPAAHEMEEAPAVLDENDPNYVDEEAEVVVGAVDVPKLAEVGVARVDVDPKLQPNV